MSKRAPSTTQLLVIAGFALSCFGILLFLWVTFGGPTPFKAKSYEVKVPFDEATQLAEQSDVRVSGVNIGKVHDIALAPNRKQALATLEIDDKYAPLPESTRAILRTKTLLGETYVELTPGDRNGPKLADGATLPTAHVAQSVQLDEIFRTFNAKTRAAFQSWQQEAAVAIGGQGEAFSTALGELNPTFTEFDRLFRVLDTQRLAVRQLFSNGAVALEALRGRQGELASLIRNSNTVFQTTARRDRDIEALFRAFPTFLDESKATLARLKTFALDADPLMRQLVPAAEQLSPTLIAFSNLAPQAKGFFEGLAPVIARAPTAFPALRKLFRDQFPPFLRALDPFLRNLNPILAGLGLYKHEITGVMANLAAASHAVLPIENEKGEKIHYLRAMGPLNPEALSTFKRRLTTNRASAYSQPLFANNVASGLPSFETRQCSSGVTASLNPNTPNEPAFNERTEGDVKKATDFFNRLKKYAFAEQTNTATLPAPGCTQQAPFNPIGKPGSPTTYQHAFEQQGK
ncbi:MAG TPA: MlaD family protein [Solirubrobacterales bacterium]|jgi:phospholipid/cholesterol/gamma-HCH transport system substrate-binding protein|nr:MlaD family protein [Solirubrobacterales bacterium]